MLCHAAVNAFGSSWLFSFVTGPDKTILWWINATLWALASTAIVLITRGRLGDVESTAPAPARTVLQAS